VVTRSDYTVIVPCHNAARTLGTTLRRLDRLIPRPHETLVVDDCSTDGSPELAAQHPGVTVLSTAARSGPGGARNAGAAKASKPILLFVDSDCYVSPGGFTAALTLLLERPELAGVMGVFSRATPAGPFAGGYKNYYRHLEIRAMPNPPPVFTSSCFLIRRDAYRAVGGFNEAFGTTPTEDNEFYFRLVRQGLTVPYLVGFSFVHDKPMTAGDLFRDDMRRARAIVLNRLGRLGEPGRTWSRGAKLRWIGEFAAGNIAVLAPVLLAPALLGAGGVAPAVAWLAAVFAFALLIAPKLLFALRDRGPWFALRLFAYRLLETVAAAAGSASAVFARRPGYNRPA
jgi:GT2 family glycosyltransferase